MNYGEVNLGDRVTTAHGPGTVTVMEQANDAWPSQPPRYIGTGRFGVKLDVNPFAGIKDGVAYYWPKEMAPETPLGTSPTGATPSTEPEGE